MNGEKDLSKTAAMLELERRATQGDWDEARVQEVRKQVEAEYPDLTPAGAEIAHEYDQAKAAAPEVTAAASLATPASEEVTQKAVEIATRAAAEDWPQDRVDRATERIGQ